MSRLESAIEKSFVRWAEKRGLKALKLNVGGRRGYPDRLVLGSRARVLFLEFKRPDEELRKLQEYRFRELIALGFSVHRVDNRADAIAICRRTFNAL